ncbi:MAG: phosphatase PAP2 family protein [Clostridia bacterium]|nr:phosphatase PAP2 family protein [Clostridia bacterium]
MSFDFTILDNLQRLRSPVMDNIMCFITHLADKGILFIALAVVLYYMPKTRKTGKYMAVALLISVLLCNLVLKNAVARLRPFEINSAVDVLISKPHDYSFPSGHTSASFAAAMALYLSGRKKCAIPAFALASLIGFSRMYLYVHFPTDVLGGAVTGILSAVLADFAIRKLDCKKRIHHGGKK